jgi:hypothetical protein
MDAAMHTPLPHRVIRVAVDRERPSIRLPQCPESGRKVRALASVAMGHKLDDLNSDCAARDNPTRIAVVPAAYLLTIETFLASRLICRAQELEQRGPRTR